MLNRLTKSFVRYIQRELNMIIFYLSVPYMAKANKNMKAFYSKMEYVTRLTHGLHKVVKKVCRNFLKVDALIKSNVMKVFVRCSFQVLKFKKNSVRNS